MNNKLIRVDNIGKGSIDLQNGKIILQRQGCSTTLNAGCEFFHVEIAPWHDNSKVMYTVYYGSQKAWGFINSGQSFKSGIEQTIESAKIEAIKAINKLMYIARFQNVTFTFENLVQDYMYSFGINYDYCNDDKIISPLRFDESENAIFNTLGKKIVQCGANDFEDVEILTIQEPEIKAINDALKSGFHQCDFKKGIGYCNKRLAWLAGEYLKVSYINDRKMCRCFVLNRKMGLES